MSAKPSKPRKLKRKPRPTATPRALQTQSSFDAQIDSAAWAGAGSVGGNQIRFLPRCVHNVEHVIDLADVSISVCDGVGARHAPAGSIVLNCMGVPKHDPAIMPPHMLKTLHAHLEEPNVTEIVLPWPDGGIPPVKPSFWRALLEVCAAEKAPLVIHCIGGHGRTGTALAAILIAYSIPAKDAIEYVREKHCNRAIETQAQVDYLEELDELLNENWGS